MSLHKDSAGDYDVNVKTRDSITTDYSIVCA